MAYDAGAKGKEFMLQPKLSEHLQLEHVLMWDAMRQLVDGLVTSVDRDTFMDDCLDRLVEVFGADRGLILLTDSSGLSQAINGRSGNRALSRYEREEISKTLIKEVLDSGECVIWQPEGVSNSAESIVTLGILSALAAPLRPIAWRDEEQQESIRGVLYLDFRSIDKQIGRSHRDFFQAAASLISVVLEQNHKLQVTREQLREAQVTGGNKQASGPSLEELIKGNAYLARDVKASMNSETSVLVLGESGTGKTMLAQALANASGRTPIVRAVLGASDDLNTITSELFGHEKGAYSGAMTKRRGLVEFADGGTLILDEVLNLPPHAQQLLLDFTQFGAYRPLGYQGKEPKRAEVRIIAATNGDLDAAMKEGRFREDLYYRLAAISLRLKPLRERREDIPFLAATFLRRSDATRDWRLSVPMRRMLLSEGLGWPGNIRQLESVIQRARLRALADNPDADTLTPEYLTAEDLGSGALTIPKPSAVVDPSAPVASRFQVETDELADSWRRLLREREALDGFETEIIELTLHAHGGVVAHAARELEVPRTSLLSRMQTLGIDRKKS